jgi:FAD/FMN-containing dehydrogenase/Fe-S oxidoreductase
VATVLYDIDVTEARREQIASEIAQSIRGEVRFDPGTRALYATDASNYRQVPVGVVVPRTLEDAVSAIRIASSHDIPIVNRGGGTSIPGQGCNTAILIDFSKYLHGVIEIDPVNRLARVEPGCVLDDLRAAAEKHELTFGPDPATHAWCTLGGMIGNNSCGVHSVMAGRTVDNVAALDVITYEGHRMKLGANTGEELHKIYDRGGPQAEIYRKLASLVDRHADSIRSAFPNIPRRVSGYNLPDLLPENGFHVARSVVGSESTLVTVLEATLHLVESPQERVLLLAGFKDIATAGDHVPHLLNFKPIGLEGLDDKFIHALRAKQLHLKDITLFPMGEGWLLVEFGANDKQQALETAKRAAASLKNESGYVDHKIYDDPRDQKAIWRVRDSGLGATAHVPGEKENWEGWEDSSVRPENIGKYIRDFHALMGRYQYHGSIYGHLGDGCLHVRLDWDVKSAPGIQKWLSFTNEAADLVIKYGGSLSGEHGDGQARAALLHKMYPPDILQAFEEFKAIWDPRWKMNPGKLVKPYGIDENLRYGASYSPPNVETYFDFPDDGHSFARATERCVSASVCRREHEGVMCPSYKATREEMHVTRGRAHLLWEMMKGDPVTGGWKNEYVREALDLCLACKGCKGECPVHVDMATYKAEFLAHYYEGKRRPRAAYSMGMIYWAARIVSRFAGLVNLVTHAPVTSIVAKRLAGIHPKRTIPRFASRTFKDWFFSRDRTASSISGKPVILWADTFNNYFHPDTAIAAVQVLEDAGFRVKVYERSMCCGRPLYDWGMLERAKRHLQNILKVVSRDVSEGIPIVVLEPSCYSVFKDELPNILANREPAVRLSQQVYLLGEFLEKFAPDYAPDIREKLIVQTHCHQESLLGHDADEGLLRRTGATIEMIPPNCCGMAGAFGFEEDKYDISMKIAEHTMLPRIRENEEAVIVASGFSCREQIEQATGKHALHLAEILQRALHTSVADEPPRAGHSASDAIKRESLTQ